MKFCMGLDGGGTKTALALSDGQSHILSSLICGTTSYRELGVEQACALIAQAIDALTAQAGCSRENVASAALGIPSYGENKQIDLMLSAALQTALAPIPLKIVNDVVVGYWGALGGEPGINIVAGTGSIAYGEDRFGHSARSGGWAEQFGDEGSCYWAGKRAMALFSREADGRVPRAALYRMIRKLYALEDDFDFIEHVERDVLPSREKTAAFQRILLEAAQQGDEAAKQVYCDAATELYLLAEAVRNTLSINRECPVTLTGGMRHAGSLLFDPLEKMLSAAGMHLKEPMGEPVFGAVLLAQRQLHK